MYLVGRKNNEVDTKPYKIIEHTENELNAIYITK